jgi:pimeloyl-ACP methyl ester carboxylesterase
MGGWLALHFAVTYLERVQAIVLIAPSGIIPPKQTFIESTVEISTDSGTAKTTSEAVMGNAAFPKEVHEFMTLVMENFNPFTGALPVLTDEQMHTLFMPVLFIAGTNDLTMDALKAAQRLTHFVPHAAIIINEGAHVITGVTDKIMAFLEKVF